MFGLFHRYKPVIFINIVDDQLLILCFLAGFDECSNFSVLTVYSVRDASHRKL